MNEAMRPNEVLIGIGYYMPERRKGFRHSANKFPTFFYLRRERFPDILRGLMFDCNGQYPICRELDETVNSLTTSGMLVFLSTMPGYYQFHPAVNLSYERIFEGINRQQARDLVQIAQEFDNEFGEANRIHLG